MSEPLHESYVLLRSPHWLNRFRFGKEPHMRRITFTGALVVAVIGITTAASAGIAESTSNDPAAESQTQSYAGPGEHVDGSEFVRENRAIEKTMNESALACMHRSGALLKYTSSALAFGGYVDGERVDAAAAGEVSEICAKEALTAGLRHVDPGLDVSAPQENSGTEGSTSLVAGGNGDVGALGGGCPNPNTARQWIYGQTGPPRWVGMNELVFLRLGRFLNRWAAYERPCYHVWKSDGCSVPRGVHPEPAFAGSCTRHDWGYRSIQKGHEIYAKRLWIRLNKAAADTRFLYDMRAKCDRMNLSSFERDRCRDKAGVYYTAVAKLYSSEHYESYDTYGLMQHGFVLP